MMKIGKQEYEILKGLDDQWKWIARDSGGDYGGHLYAYSEKPYKNCDEGWWNYSGGTLSVDNRHFQFIQWEDEEPYSIAELIEEYEREETEVKGLEWLKEETSEILLTSKKDGTNYFYYRDLKEKIYNAIDQLKEKEKVEVPQFVFDWIREHKNTDFLEEIHYLESSLTSQEGYTREEHELYFWLKKNFDDFAKAWITYPNIEVGGEPLYRARLKVITDEFIASYLRTQSSGAADRLKALEIGSKYFHEDYRRLSEFTEDELKRLDVWDSDQWEIEEVEENGQN